MSCSRKTLPEIAPIVIKSDCDSLIKSALSRVGKSAKSDTCSDFVFEIIQLSEELSKCKSDLLKSKIETASKPTTIITGKVKKSFNIDNSEVVKLRNSLYAKADSIASINADNLALKSKVKELQKLKNSTTGDSSPNAVSSGNTTKKRSWWWIYLAGMLSWFIAQNLVFKSLKIYFPILKFLP
jgi:hypothetical protein